MIPSNVPDFEVALIEPSDEMPPKTSIKHAIETDDRLELPIAQPNARQLILGMLVLTVLASLFFGSILWLSSHQDVPPGSGIRLLLLICWLIAVVGPASIWFLLPNGVLKPDHWLRYDRRLAELSIRGGVSILKQNEIICIISISDRPKRKSEIQVLSVGATKPYKHFVLNSRELNPRQAFGTVCEQFHEFAGIPRHYVIINEQGEVDFAES